MPKAMESRIGISVPGEQRVTNASEGTHERGLDRVDELRRDLVVALCLARLHAEDDAGDDAAQVRLGVEEDLVALEHLLLGLGVARVEVLTDVSQHLDDGRALHPLEVLHGQVVKHPVQVRAANGALAELLGAAHLLVLGGDVVCHVYSLLSGAAVALVPR
jgi:hypothetical protein